VVTGRLIDAEGGAPIGQGMVTLIEETTGEERVRTLTDAVGRYLLEAPAPGRYRLRVDRLGYASAHSETLELVAGDTVVHRIEASFEPVALEGIEVAGERRCRVRPEEGLATARVWEEARKALQAAAWTEDALGYRYRILEFRRTLGPEAREVRRAEREVLEGYARNPITSRPAGELIEEGFARRAENGDWLYYAPDAGALLSDAFLDTHCFELRRGEDEREGWLGLRFRPVRGRDVVGISGTFWLDPERGRLERLEYRYENLERELGATLNDRVGGEVVFQAVPNGAWIVREWRIRMPLVARQGRFVDYERHTVLAALDEVGGLVQRVESIDGETVLSGRAGTILGVAVDSTGSEPLMGAEALLVGTEDRAEVDENGLFTFAGLPEGTYRVALLHPRLDYLAYTPEPVEVEVRRGEAASVRLVEPATSEVLAWHCERQDWWRPGEGAVVLGRLTEEGAGRPAPDGIVEILWEEHDFEGNLQADDRPEFGRPEEDRGRLGWYEESRRAPHRGTRSGPRHQYWRVNRTTWGARAWPDEGGTYLICSVPDVLPLRVVGRRGSAVTDTLELRIPRDAATHALDLELPRVGGSTLAGRATDASGEPLAGARLRLRGTPFEARTDGQGRFLMARIEPGRFELEVEVEGKGDEVERAGVAQVEVGPGEARRLYLVRDEEGIGVRDAPPLGGAGADARPLDPVEAARALAQVVRERRAEGLEAREAVDGTGPGFCMRDEGETDGSADPICDPVLVLVDGVPLQTVGAGGAARHELDLDRVRTLDPDAVAEAVFVEASEARFRFGPSGRLGAVVLWTW